MLDFLRLLACALTGLFRSRPRLEAEILVLRHQLNVLRRKAPKRVAFNSIDRLVFAGLYRLAPGVLDALKILKPETVIRWHRAGFRTYWRRKSRARRAGRPRTPLEIRQLGTTNKSIDAMSSVWLRRKVFHPCDGGRLSLTMYFATVVLPDINAEHEEFAMNPRRTPKKVCNTRMHQCRVQFSRLAASWPSRTSEVCTINTSGFDFR